MAEVRLVDLEIIKRYSLAVRQEKAPAEDLLAALEASRATLEAAIATSAKKGRRGRATEAHAELPEAATEPELEVDPLDAFLEDTDDPHQDRDIFGDEVASAS